EPGAVEIPDILVDEIAAYLKSLREPRTEPLSVRGAFLFATVGCYACHSTLTAADGKPVAAYTDLLLHDMGDALNDGIKEGSANPGEWRTAPLWNTAETLKLGGLLHDGRARTVAEAI